MIWNQKEVFMGYSLQKFNEVRNILIENKIKYKYKVVNNMSNSRQSITGSFGESMNYTNIYYIYVHKKDYDDAGVAL